MGYANFKQTFWSKHIQHELEKRTILADWCNKQFQGECKHGSTVKIVGVGKPSIGNYTGASIGAPEVVDDTTVSLLINQAKFFNFMVDDVDAAQTVPGLMEELLVEASREMAIAIDSYIASLAALATNASASTQVDTATKAKTLIDAGILALRENDVQIDDEVVMELPPFLYALLRDKYIEMDTNNSALLAKGIVGRYDNIQVRISNNLYNDGTDTYAMIRTKKAIAYVSQIEKVEPYRPDDLFSDAVKALNVFGAKIVRDKEIYVMKVHK